ncbi:MAG: carbohydrate kinase [Rhizobiales bacterium]|nr:carbohydrate kinase [Hyphomicrobiales bacterium]MBA70118.1 carbohydrate kinase [Hyphomicrobiales bacterium]
MARILAIGGAHLDRTCRLEGPHLPGASNPGRWENHLGGGVFNTCRNLARLGHEVTLVSARGGDASGERVAEAAEEAGLDDRSMVFLDRATASYTAILEPDGNLVTAVADMAVYDRIPPRRLLTARFRDKVRDTDLLLCDANFPAPTLETLGLIARRTEKPLAAIAISPAKILRFSAMLGNISFLFMNAAEARALAGSGDNPLPRLREMGLRGAAITAGPAPVTAFLDDETAQLTPSPLPALSDVTGAGDALAAGFLHALSSGQGLATSLRSGVALARLTVGVPGPVRDDLTTALLDRAIAETAA